MPRKIETDDGQVLTFPDGTSDEAIDAAVDRIKTGGFYNPQTAYSKGREGAIKGGASEEALQKEGGIGGSLLRGAEKAQRGVAEAVIPPRLSQAVTEGAQALYKGPANPLLNVAARALGGAGLVAGADIATGQGQHAAMDALTEGGGAALGAGIAQGATAIRRNVSRKQDVLDTSAIGGAAKPILPNTGEGADLYEMVFTDRGQKVKKSVMDSADRSLTALEGPEWPRARVDPGIVQDLKTLRDLRSDARLAARGPEPVQARPLRELADAVEAKMLAKIKDPEKVAQYQYAKEYDTQYEAITDFLKDPTLWDRAAKRANVNFDMANQKLALPSPDQPTKTYAQVLQGSGEAGKALVSAIGRGDSIAFKDVKHNLDIGASLINLSSTGGAGGRVSTGVPVGRFVSRAGKTGTRETDPGRAALFGAAAARMGLQMPWLKRDEE